MHLVLMPPDPSGFASSHICHLWNDIVGEEGYSDFHKKNDQTSLAPGGAGQICCKKEKR